MLCISVDEKSVLSIMLIGGIVVVVVVVCRRLGRCAGSKAFDKKISIAPKPVKKGEVSNRSVAGDGREDRLPPAAAARAAWVAVATSVAAAAAHAASRSTIASTTAHAAATTISTHAHASAVSRTLATTIGTHILHGSRATATTASAATTSTASAKAGTFASDALQECGNLLVGFLQKIQKITDDTPIAAVEEGCRHTSVSGTASTTDTMDVIVNVGWQIVVDDMLDVRDIQTFLSQHAL